MSSAAHIRVSAILAIVAVGISASVAAAKPYRTVATATDADSYYASTTIDRTIRHPRKVRVLITADTATALDYSYSADCTKKRFQSHFEQGGQVAYNGQTLKVPISYPKPKRCELTLQLTYDNLATTEDDPPVVTVGMQLQAKTYRKGSR